MAGPEVSFSKSFSASNHCLPSPNGRFVAILTSSDISVRSTESLQVVHIIDLPREVCGPILSFKWAPSSRRILVAVADQIHVFSAQEGGNLHAVIRNPTPPAVKPSFVDFGATDAEVVLTSSLGLRLSVFDLSTSKTVEVANPKLYSSGSATTGYSFRPRSRHLAVLTRNDGKDMASVHHPITRECQRSWPLHTLDAHGLTWSPDGRWLLAWESPAHGHKVFFYTPDGSLFKYWSGPGRPDAPPHDEDALRPGVKLVRFSQDSRHLALADFTRTVCLLGMTAMAETVTLSHPHTISPRDDLQIWQEKLVSAAEGQTASAGFMRAAQAIGPASQTVGDSQELKVGPTFLSFDGSSALLVTVLAEWPSTVWVWEAKTAELRAVLLLHFAVSAAVWHPHIPETLLITCESSQDPGTAFLWSSSGEAPTVIRFPQEHIPVKPRATSCQIGWLPMEGCDIPLVFHSNGSHYSLAAIPRSIDELAPWQLDRLRTNGDESPLQFAPTLSRTILDESSSDADTSEDTFHFKKRK